MIKCSVFQLVADQLAIIEVELSGEHLVNKRYNLKRYYTYNLNPQKVWIPLAFCGFH